MLYTLLFYYDNVNTILVVIIRQVTAVFDMESKCKCDTLSFLQGLVICRGATVLGLLSQERN